MRHGIVQWKIRKVNSIVISTLLGRKQKFLPLFEGKLQKQTDLPKTKFAPIQSCKQRRFSDYGFSLSAEKERFLRTNLVFTLA